MRSAAELEKRIHYLEKENQYLKKLLSDAGISYSEKEINGSGNEYDPNQGSRILPRDITETDAKVFFSMFWGRTDVYSKRTIKKSTGEVNYYTQCHNFWKNGCPRITGSKIKCRDCQRQAYKELKKEQIIDHLKGNSEDATDVIGVFPLFTDDTCRFIVFDFDNHEKDAEKNDFANTDDLWKEEVDSLRRICDINGIDALVERSRSGRGAHLWIFFQKPIEAELARKFGNALLNKGAESVNLKSFRFYDRMLPMQNHLPAGGLGNLIALPLQGQALKEGNSAFIDECWNAYPDQWEALLSKKKLSKEFVEDKIKEWTEENSYTIADGKDLLENDNEKPWDKTKHFHKEDVEGILQITLSNGVYVSKANLQPMIQNQIRRMAAFLNPVYFKNQAMGLSNFENYRYIYLGSDEGEFIKVPRGILEHITEECEKAGIEYEIEDNRGKGRPIHVEFIGELKESQISAAEKLLQNDNGILNAATAFGKTVVCCNVIAKKQVNTLILLQSSALMEQWREALEKFLHIDEELPEYEMPTGRKKKRKSVIGKLQGVHDSTTGIIDLAMVGSLCKNGEYHRRLKEYGLLLVDECHHAASDTIVDILLLGPICYKYTSKDRAKEQGIEHLVYPRFTRAVAPRFSQDKMHPNEAYEIIRNNEDRDELIIRDVKQCVDSGRTPIILSKYVDHSLRLYQQLINYADKVFLLSGRNSKKEHKEILKQMNQVAPEESMILVATGKLIGEGFDYPRLDTLIMATPVAWKGVVEQYAGRLNRDYVGKKSVIIYDYVDSHISMFDRMYHKRLKAYKQIGYNIFSGTGAQKQTVSAIFDIDNYTDIYQNDMLTAEKEIIISSPAISGKKVYDMIHLLREKQEGGIKIVIVTWKPDCYGYGDSAYWQELQERMRKEGFEMNLVEDYCEHYCMIDRQVVWYGSMNFLGKEDAEDNLMRIVDGKVANELLEMTFGNEKCQGETM